MRSASLALAALLLAPAALAQAPLRASATVDAVPPVAARLAPGDTVSVTNVPEGTTSISTWQFGAGNFLFGTNRVGILGFGSAYAMPDDGAGYEVIGSSLYVTAVPAAGETFEVSVYDGTLEGGLAGEPLYTQAFATDLIEPRGADNTIRPTDLFFDAPVAVPGRVFFVTYDVAGVSTDLGVGATGDQNVAVPESVIRLVLEDGQPPEWARVDEVVSAGEGNPLETYLFGLAILRERGDPDGVVAIEAARALGAGQRVVVEGTVTRAEGTYTYLQDETGGLAIRQTSGDFFEGVNSGAIPRGSVLRVTGTLSEFNGLLQISGGALEAYEGAGFAEVPAPQVVTLAEIAANGEAYESELVRVEGVTFDALVPGDQFAASTDYAVTDGSGGGIVRVPSASDTELEGGDLTASPSIITGILIQNSSVDPDGGYKVAVIMPGDVANAAVALGASPDGRLGLSAPTPNPSAQSATVVVSMATAGPATVAVYDVLGREVGRVLDGPLAAGATPVRIDVAGLPAGTYLVRLSADGVAAARPLTVVR